MLSTHKKVPAYRFDMSFFVRDKRMRGGKLDFGE
jgi:hypothetical protein